jgi:UDP-glucose 6-dehydrogenase
MSICVFGSGYVGLGEAMGFAKMSNVIRVDKIAAARKPVALR